jgi:hypothetical protein
VRERLIRGDVFEHERSRREDSIRSPKASATAWLPRCRPRSGSMCVGRRRAATGCATRTRRARGSRSSPSSSPGAAGSLAPNHSTGYRSMWRRGAYRLTTSSRSGYLEGPRWSWPRRRLVCASGSTGFRAGRRWSRTTWPRRSARSTSREGSSGATSAAATRRAPSSSARSPRATTTRPSSRPPH